MSETTLWRRAKEDAKVEEAIKTILSDQLQRIEDDTTAEILERAFDRNDRESMTALIWFEKSRLNKSDKQTIIIDGDLDIQIQRSPLELPDKADA